MGKITFAMPDDVENKLRTAVGKNLGFHKGALGKALTEGAEMWIKNSSHRSLTKNSKNQPRRRLTGD